jgi:hypothetical protein
MAAVSDRSRRNIESVKPALGNVIMKALIAAPAWLDFAVISGTRSAEEQHALFQKGRDSDGNIIDRDQVVTFKDGYQRRSRHQDGVAVDIVAYKDGGITWDKREIEIRASYILGFAAAHGLRLDGGVRWGWDAGHLEVM